MDLQRHVHWPAPGRYVLAVSGGADSMAMLDLFAGAARRGYELAVAHFDHGLRPDSAADQALVELAATRYHLPFVTATGQLDRASEATARAARYQFLEQARHQHQAAAVLTAHHQDDLIETSLLNLARGTGRRGLAPLQAGPAAPVLRPLLNISRAQLRDYAAIRRLTWHEDATNADLTNPRNFLRHRLLTTATPAWRARYLTLISHQAALNLALDAALAAHLQTARVNSAEFHFPRPLLRGLNLTELAELLHAAARELVPAVELNQRLLQESALFALTARRHRRRPLRSGLWIASMETGLRVYYMGISRG